MSPIEILVSVMTDKQLYNVANKVWDKMTEGDGYQPFGYDRPTLLATCPEYMEVLDAIEKEIQSRKESK